jgi:capsular polysaccharide biosynthesis protein
MEFNEFLSLIKKKKQTIFTLMLVGIMLTVVLSLAQTMKYSVESRLLVVQNSVGDDSYTLSKSNEYLGNLFAEVVHSSSFYDQVLNSNYNIDRNYFSGTYAQQIKKWQKTVETKTQSDTGIIDISVYHPNVQEAKKIALAINDILINSNQSYQGGQNVRINIIDQPLSSAYPTKPNLLYNTLAAVLISFFFSIFYIYIFPEEKHSIYLFGKKTKKVKTPETLKAPETPKIIPIKYETIDKETDEPVRLNGNINNIIGR